MKTPLTFALAVAGALACEPAAFARNLPHGGGHARPQVHKPSGGSGNFRPSGGGAKPSIQRPSGNKPSVSKPGGGGGGTRLPIETPAKRPDVPSFKPAQRPGGSGGGLPSFSGVDRPATRPGAGGGGQQWKPGGGEHPNIKPAPRPGGGGDHDFIGFHPDRPGQGGGGQQWKPGNNTRPSRPGQDGGGIQWKPGGENRPGFPSRPGQGGGGEQWRSGGGRDRFPSRPGQGGGGIQWNPGGGDHPRIPDHRPNHPDRPPRPPRPPEWNHIHTNNVNQWNQWKQTNNVNINNFQVNRVNHWNKINQRWNQNGWAGRFGSDEYWDWRKDVIDFRKDRCEEIWDRREDFWDDVFDDHWWGTCAWGPVGGVRVNVNASPWWWWKPLAWAGVGAFFGAQVAAQPVVYDPGTTVIYEGDTYYVDGKPSCSATQARQAAAALATPAVEQVPVPAPAAEGQPETWLPLGVWALTQQEQGDATMFMQMSVDKNGLLAGAYKNILTGDEQPLVGQLDKQTQRVAWHIGDATQTIYETGLNSMQNDAASAFVHFGGAQTQTWLLVRLPSPEIPPGPVKLPELKKP